MTRRWGTTSHNRMLSRGATWSETAYFGGWKKFFTLWPTYKWLPQLLGQDFDVNFATYTRVYTVSNDHQIVSDIHSIFRANGKKPKITGQHITTLCPRKNYNPVHCVHKKHPLTFSVISPWMMCRRKQKLQWIYLRNGRFWPCRN